MSSSFNPMRLLSLLAGGAYAFSFSELITTNISAAALGNMCITQSNPAVAPPFPILQIGLDHILAQLGENATEAENATIAGRSHNTQGNFSRSTRLNQRDSPAQCGPQPPCADGSCCNSEGNCGFTPNNCGNTAATSCISNCNATAMCGTDSLDGKQKCPLNICCSYFGYCGTSNVFCQGADAAGIVTTPCQQGYGKCEVIPTPNCGANSKSTTIGRKLAYYQASNVRYRACNRIQPSQITTQGLTHLNLAFAAIDPVSFNIIPTDPLDTILYSQFTALKTPQLQTWIAIGGFDFSDPGPTFTTWSDMCSSAANRAAFIASLIEFFEAWGFQGVDIDWEYPTIAARGGQSADTTNLVSLVKDMRAAFGTKYGISIVLPPDFVYAAGFDPVGMEPFVDFFNYMSYDLHGPWEAQTLGALVRSQTSIIDISSTMLPLWFDAVDPAKINLGIAHYGRGYTLSDSSCTEVGCPYSGPSAPGPCTDSAGLLSLREITNIINENEITPQLLPDLMIKQIVWGGDQWMGYDDIDTIALKTQWANQNCLGGAAIWSIDFNSGPGSGDSPSITSTNGQCGLGLTCSGSPFGNCCSTSNWCGTTPAYCSTTTCQPAFGTCQPESTAETPTTSTNGNCGNGITCQGSVFGNCCSKNGYCGSTAAYCAMLEGCQESFGSCGLVSMDGSCGEGVTCQGSSFGDCCSQYGYCGGTDAYCTAANGCQAGFGTCR